MLISILGMWTSICPWVTYTHTFITTYIRYKLTENRGFILTANTKNLIVNISVAFAIVVLFSEAFLFFSFSSFPAGGRKKKQEKAMKSKKEEKNVKVFPLGQQEHDLPQWTAHLTQQLQ